LTIPINDAGGTGIPPGANDQNHSPNGNTKLASALWYASMGWPVFPLYEIVIGADGVRQCACGDPDCKSPGKHPRCQHGLSDATTNTEAIERWWRIWPNANIGVATGAVSGTVVIDVDPRNGGDVTLAELEAKHGRLPDTVRALTGGGGEHRAFAHPGGKIRSRNGILSGLDCKADGGYIVAENSNHIFGRDYTWELSARPGEVPLAPLPPWLFDLLTKDHAPTAQAPAEAGPEVIPEGKRNSSLASLAGTMRRRGMPQPAIRVALREVNRLQCKPPLSEKEVDGIAASISGYAPVFPVVVGPVQRTVARYTPFPVEAVPAPARGYIAGASRALNCDPGFVALPVIAALASCVGTTRRIMLKRSWKEMCIVWSVIVAPSGTLKSPAFDAAVEPLRVRQSRDISFYQQQMEQHEKDLLTYERDRDLYKKGKLDGPAPEKPKAPVCVRRAVADITIEALAPVLLENPRGVLLARDELAGWVKSFDAYRKGKGGDVAKWLEAHRGGELLVDRKTGPDRILHVRRAAVSVTGCIQPWVFGRVLDGENLANGFAARLLCCAPPKRVKVWTEADIDPAVAAKYDGVVDGLLALKHDGTTAEPWTPVDLEFNQDARGQFVRFYDDFGIEQAGIADEDVAAAFSKLEGYCPRLALLFHLIRAVSRDRSLVDEHRIDQGSLEAAETVTHWFCDETDRVYGLLSETEEQRDQRGLVELIQRHNGAMSVRQLQHASRRHRHSADAAKQALDALVRVGLAKWEHEPQSKVGGQPVQICRLINGGNGNTTPPDDPANGGSVTVTNTDPTGDEERRWER
jgi:hypothetical protein